MRIKIIFILFALIAILLSGCPGDVYLKDSPKFLIIREFEFEGEPVSVYASSDYYWFTTRQNGMYYIDRQSYTISHLSQLEGLLSDRIYSFEIDGDDIWVGTDMGLNVIDPSTRPFTINFFTPSEGYISEGKVWRIKADGDFVWIGGTPDITAYIKDPDITIKPDKGRFGNIIGKDWVTFTKDDGIIGDRIKAIEPTPEDVWFGTNKGAIRFYKYFEKFEFYTWGDKIKNNNVNTILYDEETIYIGTQNGVRRYKILIDKWDYFNKTNDLADNNVIELCKDSRYIYSMGPEGISSFDKNLEFWQVILRKSDISYFDFTSLCTNGTWIFAGTSSGVYYARVGEFNFTIMDIPAVKSSYVIDLFVGEKEIVVLTGKKLFIITLS